MNLEAQRDELTALQSIYPDYVSCIGDVGSWNMLSLPLKDNEARLVVSFRFPEDYPSASPPEIQIRFDPAGLVRWKEADAVMEELQRVTEENAGTVVMFPVIGFLEDSKALIEHQHNVAREEKNEDEVDAASYPGTIWRGDKTVLKRSKFMSHIAPIKSAAEVQLFKQAVLLQYTKAQNATHNILAYRVLTPEGMVEDRDDDGEGGAGDALLYMLQRKGVYNLVVMVRFISS